ncbi:hypothetical protein PZ938_16960 [Luteipulveratus sp. YIM 133132]|uniref:hypothetical protein n=1 Tax=Luteipulveratus flavus TaxID=3031728 RepID=UPI0023AFBD41|nr:hypothetical protein [Luteipulveratus sp. YIM 133132]MDE9367313.1 hypothetical protein [Luteipulveratus sp. YIM 133132]
MDVEIYRAPESVDKDPKDGDTFLAKAMQMKSRVHPYKWSKGELWSIIERWLELDEAKSAQFEIVTDAEPGPSASALIAALDACRRGECDEIADLMNMSPDDPAVELMARVHVRCDTGGVEELILEAEREVRALLPTSRTAADLNSEASACVDRLFRFISMRSADPDPEKRLLERQALLDVAGGLTAIPPEYRWPDPLSTKYLETIIDHTENAVVIPALRWADQGMADSREVSLEEIFDTDSSLLLAGRTGTGKSTAVGILRSLGAKRRIPVILCHAEAYLNGRVDSLIADGAAAVLGHDVPSAAGRRILDDPTAVVVIDGVSEVPQSVRRQLRDQIRPHVAGGTGARIVLVGRDMGAISEVMPSSREVQRIYLAPFDEGRQQQQARLRLFPGRSGSDAREEQFRGETDMVEVAIDPEHTCRRVLAQLKSGLGGGVSNPLLLDLGLQLVMAGASVRDRPALYSLTIDRMSQRANTSDIQVGASVLGIVYSSLLDEGRRYANRFEWERLLSEAAAAVQVLGVHLDVQHVRESLASSGIVSEISVGIGGTQVRAPVHDSFADYLAGRALAEGLVGLRPILTSNDEQRLLFAAEMKSIPSDAWIRVARDIPFSLVRMSEHDERPLEASSPDAVAEMLGWLIPDLGNGGVTIWQDADRAIARAGARESSWVEGRGPDNLFEEPTVVCSRGEGPAKVAVRLWAALLKAELQSPPELPAGLCHDVNEAREKLEDHAQSFRRHCVESVARLAPRNARDTLAAAVGQTGMVAMVGEADESFFASDPWMVRYRPAEIVDVSASSLPLSEAAESEIGPGTHLGVLLGRGSRSEAYEKVRKAINSLTEWNWI